MSTCLPETIQEKKLLAYGINYYYNIVVTRLYYTVTIVKDWRKTTDGYQ